MNNINFKLYLKKRKQRLSIFGASPKIDWWFIIGVTSIVFLSGIFYAVYLYININNNSFFKVPEDQTSKIANEQKKSEIKKIINTLENQNFDESAIN